MLTIGEQAPLFTAKNYDGKIFDLALFRGRKVILFFFPKAFTSGCSLETRLFRDRYREFQEMNVEMIGISTDSIEDQCAFAQKEQAPFWMIADTDKNVATMYRVLWPILGISKRVTYVLDEQGKICAIFHDEFFIQDHVRKVHQFILRQ